MKKIIFKALVALLCALGFVYLGDYALLRYRMARNRMPYDTVTIQVYYAVPQKTGKMEYDFQSSQQETCVTSLFPHNGRLPCWYARKHTDREIKL
jgi:hypothetical protein